MAVVISNDYSEVLFKEVIDFGVDPLGHEGVGGTSFTVVFPDEMVIACCSISASVGSSSHSASFAI